MNNESKIREKANDSFKTKFDMYLFYCIINDIEQIDVQSFMEFNITEDLVKIYTTEYWQEEIDYVIKGKTNKDIENDITQLEKRLKVSKADFKKKYVEIFHQLFSIEDFDKLLRSKKCHYCKITTDEIDELGTKHLLKKKNYRGWNLEIDRIDSNLEYSKENCVMACYWCNNAKTDEFNEEEFMKIGKAIKSVWDKRLGKDTE